VRSNRTARNAVANATPSFRALASHPDPDRPGHPDPGSAVERGSGRGRAEPAPGFVPLPMIGAAVLNEMTEN